VCSYLESHAHRIYSCITSPECRAARELGRHMKRGDLPENFSTRSVYLKDWSGLDSPDKVRGALVILEETGWVRRSESQPPLVGRPSENWIINPKLRTHK